MTTLNQIRELKKETISAKDNIPIWEVNLTDEQQNDCFGEWLQQKPEGHIKNCACYICEFRNKFLKELEQ